MHITIGDATGKVFVHGPNQTLELFDVAARLKSLEQTVVKEVETLKVPPFRPSGGPLWVDVRPASRRNAVNTPRGVLVSVDAPASHCTWLHACGCMTNTTKSHTVMSVAAQYTRTHATRGRPMKCLLMNICITE